MNLIFIPILVALSACFVAVEVAFARSRRSRIDQLALHGNKEALLAQKSLDSPDKFISACQLGVTLATLLLGVAAEHAFAEDLASSLMNIGLSSAHVVVSIGAKAACYVIAFSCIALLQTLFGELLPKMLTFQRAERVLLIFIRPMEIWQAMTAPILFVLNACTRTLITILNIKEPLKRDLVESEEELKMLVAASHEQGVLEDTKRKMLRSVFDFSDAVADKVMTPLTDVLAISTDSTTRDFVEMAVQHGRTRIPVYEGNIDNITGFVHIKDALKALHEQKPDLPVRELSRKVLIIPENKNLGDLLKEFDQYKTHMAVVLDEYGATCGIVTIQDLLEELVGDIADEHEVEHEAEIVRLADGSYTIDAKLPLDELREKTDLHIVDSEFNTLAGHVFGLLGKEPQIGDEVEDGHYRFRVEAADGHRITRVHCRKIATSKNT